MQRRLVPILLALLLALAAASVSAQDSIGTVTFNGFSFSFPSSLATNVNIEQFAGDPLDAQYPGGPQPAYTRFSLYSELPAPESALDAPVAITVYNLSETGQYTFYQQQIDALRTLLTDRPDLGSFMTIDDPSEIGGETLPFLPVFPAAQEIRARAQYLDVGTFSGVEYVTSYGQDASPILSNELIYTFQGLSADGTRYVSLQARLDTGLIPAEIPADFNYDEFIADISGAFNETIATVSGAAPTDFTPSLDLLRGVVMTFNMGAQTGGVLPTVPTPVEMTPTPTAAVVNTDPTLGGLVGAWNLVSFGPADAQQLPVEGAPITIAFSDQGVAGSDACNSYAGSFTYNAGSLTFSPLVTTLIACSEPIGTVASAYTAALQAATAYTISGDTLTISYPEGTLTFARAG
ncbi:MAG: META domain-containing protein [Chloroflexi bacterium]|nr:META domain-containing protein [Chloroflexota bacterium]